jgi:OmcA/MtrC family decaheme c-type cytochrome
LVFGGCEGDQGPPGPQGPPGETGGILTAPFHRADLDLSGEACTVCHGPGGIVDVEAVHGDPPEAILPELIGIVDMDANPELLENVAVVSQIEGVSIASPPVVTFTLETANGIPINGLVRHWNDSDRYVRFTITKLVPGTNGDPDSWVAYTRDTVGDGSTSPDYDTGASLVEVADGTYAFTFNTDVAAVTGVPYEPDLTHRIAGQIGSSSVPLEAQNLFIDFVPSSLPTITINRSRNIAVMDSCNECHDDLVFHGRRFKVEYCVQCHNPDLAGGEGNMSFMIHRIHSAGAFTVLGTRGGTRPPADFGELTYPQDLNNCRKCHSAGLKGGVTATSEGDNWINLPNIAACDGCHEVFSNDTHTGGTQTDNSGCAVCHNPADIEEYHVTPNVTRHNPSLLQGAVIDQRNIEYELIAAIQDMGAGGVYKVDLQILSDGTPLDLTNLPQDLLDGNRYPGLLLAWAQPQGGISMPADFNNLGRRGAQPLSISLGDLAPIDPASTIGTITFAGGVNTVTFTDPALFPTGATMRTVGLQGYLRQDLDGDGAYDVSLHTPSKMVTVTGDDARRVIVDNNKCSNCHEFFEGHGGNRVFTYGATELMICVMCHTPNTSSSGRTITTIDQRLTDSFDDWEAEHGPITHFDRNDPLTYPEDSQNLKDMIHGIHSEGFRTRDFEHVRGGRNGYWNWSHVTFPRGAETSNCQLCHLDGTYELAIDSNALPTTVRTTGVEDGDDPDSATVEGAFVGVPNATDWVNTPMASACGYCHTWTEAISHMQQMGGFLNESAFAK